MGMVHGLRLFTEAALFLLLELVAIDGQSEPSHWSVPRVAWKYFIMTRQTSGPATSTHVESLHNPLDDLEGTVILHG